MPDVPDVPDVPERPEVVRGFTPGGPSDIESDPSGLDLEGLLQQAMAMQQRLVDAQAEARATTVEGQAGGGLVRITLTGGGDVQAVRIAPDAVDPDDIGMLEDLVLAAFRDAIAKVQQLQADSLGQLGELGDLGGLGGLLG